MTKALATVPYRPTLFIRDGEIYATSESISKDFHKKHGDVLKAIDNLNCSDDFRRRNFAPSLVSRRFGFQDRDARLFHMTKDGFAFLVMGFTGETAGQFKEAYIAEFNRMRDELAAQASTAVAASAPFQINMRDPAFAAAALLQAAEIVREAQAETAEERRQKTIAIAYIDETAPLVEIGEEVVASEELSTLSQAARIIGCGHDRFFAFVEGKYLFREGGKLVPYAPYRHSGHFKVNYARTNGKLRPQTLVSNKGVAMIKAAMAASRRDLLSSLGRLPQGVTRTPTPSITGPSS